MKRIGAHVSAAGGVHNTPVNANNIGAKAFGLFTKNQRQWNAKPLSEENIRGFKENCQKLHYSMDYILPHASYLINLGNPRPDGLEKSRKALLDESIRCEQLGIKMLNVHPGAHLKKIAPSDCLSLIADSINWVHERSNNVSIIIENTAGQGSSMGFKFDQLASIIEEVSDKKRVGVCIDTCHAFAAGYNLSSDKGYQDTFAEFEQTVGYKYLKGFHINDSKKPLGSRVDRHEKIGDGLMGLKAFEYIMNDQRLDEIPMILETPDRKNWAREIHLLYKMVET
ncbi:MAG TPA: deoxyribonuclease IV [Balneolales bacterium]|nr:deoxyribonuclease IV [Balneolales bacterium]